MNQTITGLAAGRKIKGKVGFLGGPLHFLPQLVRRFKETLDLTDEETIVPEHAEVYAAIGAALHSKTRRGEDDAPDTLSLAQLLERMEAAGNRLLVGYAASGALVRFSRRITIRF